MKEMKSKKVQVIKKPAVKKTAVRKPVLKNTEEEPALSLVTLHNLKRPFGARKRKNSWVAAPVLATARPLPVEVRGRPHVQDGIFI